MINAAQPALFVSAPKQAGAPMRTPFIDDTDPAVSIPKRQKVFPEQLDSNRRTIGRFHLLR
jgi:hypothetical protein